jgi:hypothetical protein
MSENPMMQPGMGGGEPPASDAEAAFVPGMTPGSTGDGPPPVMEKAPPLGGRMGAIVTLVVVTAVAGAGLWAMRQMATGIAIAALKLPDIDYPLEGEGAAVLNPERDALLEDLNSSGRFPQVPLEQVQMNPFELKGGPKKEEVVHQQGETEAQKRARLTKQRLDELKSEAAGLRLASVMGGGNPMAVINGEVLGVGESIRSYQIVSIKGRTVVLEAHDDLVSHTHTLSLD